METLDYSKPIQISENSWWVGTYIESDKFQCNPYLYVADGKGVLIDSGSVLNFDDLIRKVSSVIPLRDITHVIAQHQDPDVCGNICELMNVLREAGNTTCLIYTHYRTSLLIKHYGKNLKFEYTDRLPKGILNLGNGHILEITHTPYLHAPGAITTYAYKDKILFSSDIFGGVTEKWNLYAGENYYDEIISFHKEYMPSKEILLYGMSKLEVFDIDMIAPQHGSIMNREQSKRIIEKFKDFECGLYIDRSFRDELQRAQELIKEQNRIMSEEMGMAATYQQKLLPSRDLVFCDEHVDFAYYTKPCSQVSGDFIILQKLGNDCDVIGMLVIDVMGHGVSAGLATMEVKSLFEEAKTVTTSPAETLRILNGKASSISANGIFFTATYAVFSCRDRKLTVASAGGIPILHHNLKSGLSEVVDVEGLPVGLFKGDEFEISERSFDIVEGDCFVLQTDGIIECSNEADESFDRLKEQTRFLKHVSQGKTSKEIIDGIIGEATAFKGEGRDFEDDLTIVVFQLRG